MSVRSKAVPQPVQLLVDPAGRAGVAPAPARTVGFWNVVELMALSVAVTMVLLLLLGYQLVILTSASMSPAAPAGSVLIVSSVPAEQVEVDDIIVMGRGQAIPITHRVIELLPHGTQTLAVTKGDANRTADPVPYSMDGDQRVVRAAVPKLGWLLLIAADSTPELLVAAALIGLTLVVTGGSARDFPVRAPGRIRRRFHRNHQESNQATEGEEKVELT